MKQNNYPPEIAGKILIVDDEPDLVDLYAANLQKYNFEVLTAGNGQEAWDIFQQEKNVPVVVTDINMPQMNGVELLMKISNIAFLTQFIIITGFLDDSVSLFGVKNNVVCLPKPVEKEFVAIAVAGALERYQHNIWQEKLKTATTAPQWDEQEIMQIIKKSPWL